jgi:cold shock CspA family protein
VVKFWHAERGWGAISSDELPPGRDAWVHFSHIMGMPRYRSLEVGQAVASPAPDMFRSEHSEFGSFDPASGRHG